MPKQPQSYLSKASTTVHNIWKYQWNWYKIAGVIASLGAALTMRKVLDVVWRKWHNYPPGPVGLPLFGSYLWSRNYYYVTSLMNTYGSVTMINYGVKRLIFIDDMKMTKTFFNMKEGAKRGHQLQTTHKSISEADGKKLVFRRQMMHQSFVTVLDSNYLNQVGIKILQKNLFKSLDEAVEKNKSIHMFVHVKYAVFSLLFATIFGDFLEIPAKDSKDYKIFDDGLSKTMNNVGNYQGESLVFQNIPFSKMILDNYWRPDMMKGSKISEAVVGKWVDQTLKLRHKSQAMDVCIKPMINAYKSGKLTEKELKSDVQAIFVAGIHTTALFASEAFTMCAKKQSVQNTIYEEIKRFERKYGEFQLKHVEEFPTLRALIHENLRFASFGTAHGIPRIIKDDNIVIGGYNIPKGSIIWGFYTKMMHEVQSPDIKWRSPLDFDLNNFLEYEDEQPKFKLNPAFSAFGYGRRNCPGSSLAKREIYLLLGRTLLRYKILPTDTGYDNIPQTVKDVKIQGAGDLHRYIIAKSVKVVKR
eukprot:263707_1